jgi:hypothetical protein
MTVPSSSTSMPTPYLSWRARMVLPPGPMSLPIFSGLMWRVIEARGVDGDVVAGPGDDGFHLLDDLEAALLGLLEDVTRSARRRGRGP